MVSVYRPYVLFHGRTVAPVALLTNEKGEIKRQISLLDAVGAPLPGFITGAAVTSSETSGTKVGWSWL